MTEKIFVTGATESIGAKLVKFFLKKNTEVTVYARVVEKAKKLHPQSENLHVVQSDYSTMNMFEREIAGHSHLFILVTSFDNMVEPKRTFAKVAYAAGVRQVVDVSSALVNQPYHFTYIGYMDCSSEEAILAEKSDDQFHVAPRPSCFLSNHFWQDVHSIKDIVELASVVLTEPVEKHTNCVYPMISKTLTANEPSSVNSLENSSKETLFLQMLFITSF